MTLRSLQIFTFALLLSGLFSGLMSGSLFAQSITSAQISGTVHDSTGAAIPGAQVTVTQTATGATRSTTTGEDGTYVLPTLPIGPYKLEVKKEGFGDFVQSGIELQVASKPSIDAVLKVGALTEQVVVEADAAMVETHATGVGQVVDQRRVTELPLNGRLATQLITLAGAAVVVPAANLGQLSSGKNYPNEAVISVAGGMSNGLSYLVDGGNYNDPLNNSNLPLPFPDALQEFKVETSALPAAYGQHSAGAVNAATKSGTNEIHGDLFEFLRNGVLNARDFFAPARDSLKRNQFGGTVGGPIKKDQLFFFAGFQGTFNRSAPVTGTSFIPTPAMLSGDFSTIASPACNAGRQITIKNPANGQAYPNNQIPVSSFSAPALKMLTFGYGSTSDPCGKVQFGAINSSTEEMGLMRLDYQRSSKESIFGRYFVSHNFQPSSYTGSPLSITLSSPDDMVNSIVLGDTYVFRPNLINSFRGTFNRSAIIKTQVPFFGASDLGIVGVTELIPKFLQVMVSGALYSAALQTNPGSFFTNTYQIADDMTFVKGAHQIQFGENYIRPMQIATVNFNSAGGFTFNGSVTGLSMADFLLGVPSSFADAAISHDDERWHYFGAYIQDSWKANSRLTLNYGLRWEPYMGGTILQNQISRFDQGLFAQGVHSTVYPNAPAGMLFPGDSAFNTDSKPSNTKLNDFAPRFGAAWDPKGDGRMTVRGSWGMFYDIPHTLFYYAYSSEPPWGESLTINNPPGGFSNPWLGFPGGNPFPVQLSKNVTFPTGGNYQNVPLNLHPTYLEQWNLSFQKQIGSSWLASVSYLGNSTIHLATSRETNPAVYIPGNCAAGQYGLTAAGACSTTANTISRRALNIASGSNLINTLATYDDGGTGSYNAILLSAQHRLASHFTLLVNYTHSHCISDPVITAIGGAYSDPTNRRADRGSCPGVDIRRNLNVSAVAESPRFAQSRILQAVAGDWRLSPIISAHSGPFVSVTTGVDNALTGIGNQRPNQILPSAYCANQSINCWVNALAFASPAAGTRGNLGVNTVQTPHYVDFDLALSRVFRVRERQSVEFRAEGFNIANHANFGPPVGALNSATFGKILTDFSPRIMQVALKVVF